MANNSPTPTEQERRYGWYLERVKERRQWAEKLSQGLDKLIFASASGALVLSVTFVDKIVVAQNINQVWILITSWIFLILTIFLNLLSIEFALKSTAEGKKRLDIWFKSGAMEAPDESKNWKEKLTVFFDLGSQATLIIGIILMTYFVSLNIRGLTMSNNPQENSDFIKKAIPAFSNPLPPAQPTSPAQGPSTAPMPTSLPVPVSTPEPEKASTSIPKQ